MYSVQKCIKCGTCVEVCPERTATTETGIITLPSLCKLCGNRVNARPTKALEMSGKVMSVGEIISIIEKERPFFEESGGGVTFSGGEPLTHSELD